MFISRAVEGYVWKAGGEVIHFKVVEFYWRMKVTVVCERIYSYSVEHLEHVIPKRMRRDEFAAARAKLR
jgi:hypothetical protein